MKSTLAYLFALALSSHFTLAQYRHGNQHHVVPALHARHAAYWADRRAQAKRRLSVEETSLVRRKTLGWGDSASVPANVAKGSDDDSCTCWHEVADGEVCLGLIDKSSSGFTLEKFFELNPSLSNDCNNLKVGVSYCVDDGPSTSGAASGQATKASATSVTPLAVNKAYNNQATSQTPSVAAAVAVASAANECEEYDDEDDEYYDDEDDEEYNATSSANVAQVTVNAKVAVAQTYPASSQQKQQQQQQQTTWQQPTIKSSTVQAQPTSTSTSNGLGQLYTGTATFYYQNGVAGACGTVSADSAKVAAIFTGIYASGANCGRQIRVTNTDSGASVVVTAMDLCPSCTDNSHIDLSTGAYNELGLQSKGVLPITWQFIS